MDYHMPRGKRFSRKHGNEYPEHLSDVKTYIEGMGMCRKSMCVYMYGKG